METKIPDAQLSLFSEFIAETMGLDFPASRRADLQRGIVAAAGELGFDDASACIEWLMSGSPTRNQLEIIASNLTVGETYFFREAASFDALADRILPALINERQDGERRLRIWSAACCTGEEPYSIAMTLHRTIPHLESWNVTVMATDINPRFLQKATAGVYGQWSFRGTAPWVKDRYFQPAAQAGQFEIRPEIKRMVRFATLNLVEDVYPSPINDTNAMDVIFCRNVLMYFTAPQAIKVIRKLYRAQTDGGWLFVSPSELPHGSSSLYRTVNYPSTVLYQKDISKARADINRPSHFSPDQPMEETFVSSVPLSPVIPSAPRHLASAEVSAAIDVYKDAATLHSEGRYAEAVETLKPALASAPGDPALLRLLAHSLANQGRLSEALDCCARWIAADKVNSFGHYLRAVILQEQGDMEEAIQSLRRAIYVDPDFVLAHFALGNIARSRGRLGEADKQIAITRQLLSTYAPQDVIPESEGVTAGQLSEMINSMVSDRTNK